MSITANSKLKVLVSSLGIATVAGFLLAGCTMGSKEQNEMSSDQISPAAEPTEMTQVSPGTSVDSSSKSSQSFDETVTTEGESLNKLNQDATTVDKSMNDQAINVN